ncbi:hypothetical protein M8J75_016059 [Diaphorina citri]|nr:hypothetical protein M8J75_016059 [Diaphorina citri]
MPVVEKIGRRNCIPILYTRGTHYEVGFDVGRTFSGIIKSFLETSGPLNDTYLPLYETDAGRRVYDATLASVRENFPQYVEEIEGTADGAKVPFHKLFLLHMDDITPNVVHRKSAVEGTVGCSSVCCNQKNEVVLGHTEDALSEVLNHIYFVSAHIISDKPRGRWAIKEEKFTSLCYAGHLPGFTMSYNNHGLVYSINVVSAKTLSAGKTPRFFLTRALLGTRNLEEAQSVLRDRGVGAADGFSVNMTFLNQEGNRLFHNAEVGPNQEGNPESAVNILTCSQGEFLFHCNKYLRLDVPEVIGMMIDSSDRRQEVMDKLGAVKSKRDVISLLGDQTGGKPNDGAHPIFRDEEDGRVKTVAVGIFDLEAKTWSIYTDNPKKSDPIVILPLDIRNK